MAESAEPKITVLVPTYNVERYLPQCLDALCAQTLRDIEIICINDGATDGSPSILRSYAAKDQRIRIIDKPNSGYGASLNRGIAEAKGEYIGIVEPDDFPDKRMFKKLYKDAKRANADVAKCNFFNYFDGATTYGTTLQSANVVSPLIPLASRISSALFLLSGRGCIVARFWNVKASFPRNSWCRFSGHRLYYEGVVCC